MWKGYVLMNNKIEIVLSYDFDPEKGYTEKTLQLDRNEWAIYEDVVRREQKLIIRLYPEDIKNLLEGTGIDLDEI